MKSKSFSTVAADAFAALGICLAAFTILAYSYAALGLPRIYHIDVPKMAALRVAALALAVSLIIRLLLWPGFALRFLRMTWPLLLWFAWRAASLFWTEFGWATVAALADDACLLAAALGLVGAFASRDLAFFAKVAVGCAALIALGIFFFMPDATPHPPFANENLGGTIFAFAAAGALCYLAGAFRPSRQSVQWPRAIAGAVCFALFIVGLIEVRSIGAFLGLLAGIYVLLLVVSKRRMIILAATALLLVAGGAILRAKPEAREQLLGKRFESTSWVRIYIWSGAADMLADRPILGHGAGTFGAVNVRYQPKESYLHVGIERASSFAHSYPLAAACETGIIGLALFAWVLVFTVRQGRRVVARDEGARHFVAAGLVPLAALVAHGAVEVTLYQPHIQIFMWAAIAIVLGEGLRSEAGAARSNIPAAGRAGAGYAIRVIAALALSCGAVGIWGTFFAREIGREIAFSRGYYLMKDALARGDESTCRDLVAAQRDFAAAIPSRYASTYTMEAAIQSGKARMSVGVNYLRDAEDIKAAIAEVVRTVKEEEADINAPEAYGQILQGMLKEKAGTDLLLADKYLEQAVSRFEQANDAAYGFHDVDVNLGLALVNLWKLRGEEAVGRRGCEMLAGYLERDPFNSMRDYGREKGGATWTALAAIHEYLGGRKAPLRAADKALARRVVAALEEATRLIEQYKAELPAGARTYRFFLDDYRGRINGLIRSETERAADTPSN